MREIYKCKKRIDRNKMNKYNRNRFYFLYTFMSDIYRKKSVKQGSKKERKKETNKENELNYKSPSNFIARARAKVYHS